MSSITRTHLSLLRSRFGALACLLTVLLGPSQVVPGLLAVGAVLEGSHTVQISRSGEGFRLVLRHEAVRSEVAAIHQHGMASRVLCLLADQGTMNPDHVATFTVDSAWEKLNQLSAPDTKMVQGSGCDPASTVNRSTCLRYDSSLRPPFYDHGPPSHLTLASPISVIGQ